ncbi:uncharacterized protein MELLADRAFT_124096 [Melampsora larici-populina 98AG31]|uniref:Copper acquisition factor BIM1-like domain-containing protein n=1 Tax=Melampsora larici-populina (strain 98AG31 / pathotype 3-4-7) TaxID=747676 RepID=F4RRM4_MELLP|nr:uncharacterized protein MELLADRAFT_124096 [Melampsora larici-populina 98AG31]EGG04997.1 hypothetical protein MELLADRAFT_124096 [Melampsora larici-populina 98AG31]
MFSKTLPSILLALVLASLASAHFTLDSPPTRLFKEEMETKFCGGAPNPSNHRTKIPLSGKFSVCITSHHEKAEVNILLSTKSKPVSDSDFSNNGKTNYLLHSKQIKGQKKFCFDVDIGSLKHIKPLPKKGSSATIQVEFHASDGKLFQCADLILS